MNQKTLKFHTKLLEKNRNTVKSNPKSANITWYTFCIKKGKNKIKR